MLGVQSWFSERVRTALDESLAVAEAYLDEHRNAIRADVLAMADDLNREGPTPAVRPAPLRAVRRRPGGASAALTEAVAFDGQGQVLARSGLTMSL